MEQIQKQLKSPKRVEEKTTKEKFDEKVKCLFCREEIRGVKHPFRWKTSSINFRRWDEQCLNSICKMLFKSEFHPYKHFIQKGGCCLSCQQIVWDLDFTVSAIQKLKTHKENLTNKILKSIYSNYRNIQEEDPLKRRGRGTSKANTRKNFDPSKMYTFDEAVEMIYNELDSSQMLSKILILNSPQIYSQKRIEKNTISSTSNTAIRDKPDDFQLYSENSDMPVVYLHLDDIQEEVMYEETVTTESDNEGISEEVNFIGIAAAEHPISEPVASNDNVEIVVGVEKPSISTADHSNKVNEAFRPVTDQLDASVSKSQEKKSESKSNDETFRIVLVDDKLADNIVTKSPKKKSKSKSKDETFRLDSNENDVDKEPPKKKPKRKPVKNFKCIAENCPMIFYSQANMKIHYERKHSGLPGKFSCSLCDKRFYIESDLRRHKAIHRIVQTNFDHICKVCSKGFETLTQLVSHSSRVHEGEYPFSCEDCDKVFTFSNDLVRHVKEVHSSSVLQEPPRCDICDKPFNTIYGIRKHKRSVHADFLGIKLKCTVCDITFETYELRRKHQKTVHSKTFNCDQCNMQFKLAEGLKVHMVSHTKERAYVCKVCGAGFGRNSTLVKHEKRHSGIHSSICDRCGKGFSSEESLKLHYKMHLKNPNYKYKSRQTMRDKDLAKKKVEKSLN